MTSGTKHKRLSMETDSPSSFGSVLRRSSESTLSPVSSWSLCYSTYHPWGSDPVPLSTRLTSPRHDLGSYSCDNVTTVSQVLCPGGRVYPDPSSDPKGSAPTVVHLPLVGRWDLPDRTIFHSVLVPGPWVLTRVSLHNLNWHHLRDWSRPESSRRPGD